jgi:hypothetical protein
VQPLPSSTTPSTAGDIHTITSEYAGNTLDAAYSCVGTMPAGGRLLSSVSPKDSWRSMGMGGRLAAMQDDALQLMQSLKKMHGMVGGGWIG